MVRSRIIINFVFLSSFCTNSARHWSRFGLGDIWIVIQRTRCSIWQSISIFWSQSISFTSSISAYVICSRTWDFLLIDKSPFLWSNFITGRSSLSSTLRLILSRSWSIMCIEDFSLFSSSYSSTRNGTFCEISWRIIMPRSRSRISYSRHSFRTDSSCFEIQMRLMHILSWSWSLNSFNECRIS